jgi:UDP-GlcNAc:undecaprenyl-phosphate GlcNAc-1-phosphate transferase
VKLALVGLGLVGVSFVLSVGFCGLVRLLAPRVGLVDRPGGRKAHERVTPLGGGVAIWLAVVAVLVLGAVAVYFEADVLPPDVRAYVGGLRARGETLLGIVGLGTLIMLMGLFDDKKALSTWPRLVVQVVLASIFVIFWGRVTLFLPQSLGIVRVLTGLLTVAWIVGLTNSFNFLDNMDGLAASVGLIAALVFAVAQIMVGGLFVPAVLLILVGALGGFLYHNVHPARLFMGDAGSNFLGFLLGTMTVAGNFARPYEALSSPFSVLTPLVVMAVPLYDTASVILIRLREGRSPFQADRRHFSHRLVERGLSPPRAVATIDLVTLTAGLGALLLPRMDAVGAVVIVAQTVCLMGVVGVLEWSVPAVPRPAPPPLVREDAGLVIASDTSVSGTT